MDSLGDTQRFILRSFSGEFDDVAVAKLLKTNNIGFARKKVRSLVARGLLVEQASGPRRIYSHPEPHEIPSSNAERTPRRSRDVAQECSDVPPRVRAEAASAIRSAKLFRMLHQPKTLGDILSEVGCTASALQTVLRSHLKSGEIVRTTEFGFPALYHLSWLQHSEIVKAVAMLRRPIGAAWLQRLRVDILSQLRSGDATLGRLSAIGERPPAVVQGTLAGMIADGDIAVSTSSGELTYGLVPGRGAHGESDDEPLPPSDAEATGVQFDGLPEIITLTDLRDYLNCDFEGVKAATERWIFEGKLIAAWSFEDQAAVFLRLGSGLPNGFGFVPFAGFARLGDSVQAIERLHVLSILRKPSRCLPLRDEALLPLKRLAAILLALEADGLVDATTDHELAEISARAPGRRRSARAR